MRRTRTAELQASPNFVRYTEWILATKKSRALKQTTISGYANDVARWIVDLQGSSLASVRAPRIARFLEGVKPSYRGRTLSAVSDFWAFAMQKGWVERDEPRLLKFRRSKHSLRAQLDFFELLRSDGLTEPQILKARWKDFLTPVLEMRKGTIRTGRLTRPIPTSWSLLETEFRYLASRNDLEALLKRPIISMNDPRRAA